MFKQNEILHRVQQALDRELAKLVRAVKGDSEASDGHLVEDSANISPELAKQLFAAGVAAGRASRVGTRRGQKALDVGPGVAEGDAVNAPGIALSNETQTFDDKAAAVFRSASAHRARTAGLAKALGIQVQGTGMRVSKTVGPADDPLPRSTLRAVSGSQLKK